MVANPLAQHPELREAFALSLNRDTINQVVFEGQYVPGCTPIPPNSPYAPNITCPGQDLAKARKLVAQSGVKTPINVNLIIEAADSQASKLGTVVQSMAKKAGFAVHVQPTEFTTALDQSEQGHFTTFDIGWSGRLDPDQNIAPFWDPTSTLNYSGSDYSDINTLMTEEQSTSDQAKRRQIFTQISQDILRHNDLIYLYYPKVVMGYRSDIKGIGYHPDGLIHLKTASVSGG
jgi:peptide/nickel transport system substrate-binding protein